MTTRILFGVVGDLHKVTVTQTMTALEGHLFTSLFLKVPLNQIFVNKDVNYFRFQSQSVLTRL